MRIKIKKEVILVGSIKLGKLPDCGESMKNQLFLRRFDELFEKVIAVDTFRWPRRPWCLVKLFWFLLLKPKANFVISTSTNGRYLLKVLRLLPLKRNVYYWVVGGALVKKINVGLLKIKDLKNLKAIIVQGQSMVDDLNRMGLNNSIYVPNSKPLGYIPQRPKSSSCLKFVFMSRVHPDKGIKEIFEANDILVRKGYDNFLIDFYGKIAKGYECEFKKLVDSSSNTKYKGYLNLMEHKGYDTLASYDCMLFPSYWSGEGFPGVVLDANISGLPVIASDWNLNKSVIKEDYNGVIIPTHDSKTLAKRMEKYIDDPEQLLLMRTQCVKFASKYDYRIVLSKELFEKLGFV